MALPKETFFNLPPDKRERVIDAALDEFAERSYHDARVTAIAENAGIAKGSFYQYFEDKKDLFKYIIGLIADKKLEYINKDMMGNMQDYGFFQVLRELYLSGIRFAKEHPRLLAIGMQLMNNQALYHEVFTDYVHLSCEFYGKLLMKGVADGDIDPTIDITVTSRLLTMCNYALVELIGMDGFVGLDDMAIIEKMLRIVENGIKRKAH